MNDGPVPDGKVQPWQPKPAVEYAANLQPQAAFGSDLKPLQVVQPDGSSLKVNGRRSHGRNGNLHLAGHFVNA